jgi:hypothetical protein
MKYMLILLLFTLQGVVFAGTELSVSCSLNEKSIYSSSSREVLELSTLSDSNLSSYSIKPRMAFDNSALYILSLSLGDEYSDSDGEIVGSDYYLSLVRLNSPGSSGSNVDIKGRTENVMKIESFEGRATKFSKKPHTKAISLDYKIGQREINLECQILSLR